MDGGSQVKKFKEQLTKSIKSLERGARTREIELESCSISKRTPTQLRKLSIVEVLLAPPAEPCKRKSEKEKKRHTLRERHHAARNRTRELVDSSPDSHNSSQTGTANAVRSQVLTTANGQAPSCGRKNEKRYELRERRHAARNRAGEIAR